MGRNLAGRLHEPAQVVVRNCLCICPCRWSLHRCLQTWAWRTSISCPYQSWQTGRTKRQCHHLGGTATRLLKHVKPCIYVFIPIGTHTVFTYHQYYFTCTGVIHRLPYCTSQTLCCLCGNIKCHMMLKWGAGKGGIDACNHIRNDLVSLLHIVSLSFCLKRCKTLQNNIVQQQLAGSWAFHSTIYEDLLQFNCFSNSPQGRPTPDSSKWLGQSTCFTFRLRGPSNNFSVFPWNCVNIVRILRVKEGHSLSCLMKEYRKSSKAIP